MGAGAMIRDRGIQVAAAVLCVQAVAFHFLSQNERAPKVLPLALVSLDRGGWREARREELDRATADILRPDDYLYTLVVNERQGVIASVFVAYFLTQRTGHAPHTPRNCLPGHGWVPSRLGTVELEAGGPGRLEANRYLIQKENDKAVVVYWYQTGPRTVANEYKAKLLLIWDAIRHRRSDTALVRVIVPVSGQTRAAEQAAGDLAKDVYRALAQHFPGW